MKKRVIAWLLMLCMLLTAVPAMADTECTNHDYKDTRTLREGTCEVVGIYEQKCAICGDTKYVARTGHKLVDTVIDATCTKPAQAGKKCTLCDYTEEMKNVEGSKALGHNLSKTADTTHKDYVAATCTEKGLDVFPCSRCDYVEKKVTPAKEHKQAEGTAEHVDATCEKPAGVRWLCQNCGEYVFEAYTGELAVDKLGHQYTVELLKVEPTCKTAGYTIMACKRCGATEIQNKINPGPEFHDRESYSVVRAATCTSNGIGKYSCSVCGEDFGYKVIPFAHNFVEVSRVDATCEKAGVINYVCSLCGKEDSKEIPNTGMKHNMVDGWVDATCEHGALTGKVCSVCGYYVVADMKPVEDSDPVAHKWVPDPDKLDEITAPTCTEAGKVYEICSYCGISNPENTIPALGHDWDDGVHADATCTTAAGVKKTCSVCGETEIEEYTLESGLYEAALGHKDVETVVEPTCSKQGYTLHTCERCGYSYMTDPTPKAAEHDYSKLINTLKEATCTTDGIGKYQCANCTETIYKLIKDGHAWEVVDYKLPTCGEDGWVEYACAKCDVAHKKVEAKDDSDLKATGKHEWVKGFIPATCTEYAKTGEKCSVCGAERNTTVDKTNKPLGHNFKLDTTHEDYEAVTCTKNGLNVYTCTRCGYRDETLDEVTTAKGHVWGLEEPTEATCEKGPGMKKTCSVCGAVEITEYKPGEGKLGHDYKVVEETKASCTKAGYKLEICSICQDKKETKTAPNGQHNEQVVVELKAATCTADGVGKFQCLDCGKDLGYKIIKAAGHKFDKLVEKIEATCKTDGKEVKQCKCGLTDTKIIKATGEHSYVVVDEKDATCTTPATYSKLCTVCGDKVENLVVDDSVKLNHMLDGKDMKVLDTTSKKYVKATCGKAGNDVFVCQLCNKVFDNNPTAALSHDYKVVGEVGASCEFAEGTAKICSNCGDYTVVPKDGGKPALDHDYVHTTIVEPTCKTKGSEVITCTRCDYSKTKELAVVADAHVFDVKVMKEPDCKTKTNGIKSETCTVKGCGVIKYSTIPYAEAHDWSENMAGHDCVYRVCGICGEEDIVEDFRTDKTVSAAHIKVSAKNGTEATCTTDGRESDMVCSICGKVMSIGQTIKATGHKMVEVEGTAKAATCTEAGKAADKKCSVCGAEEKGTEIPAIGHKMVEVEGTAKAATCTEAGKEADKKCSVCGAEEKGTEIPATGHKMVEVEGTAKAATCTEAGKAADKKCSVCGAEEKGAEIPALSHDIVVDAAVAATCTEAGKTAGEHCTRCDYAVAQEVIPATGHDIVVDAAVAATCTSEGKTAGEHCTKCDHKVAQETIPMKAHSYKTVYSLSEDGTMRIITKTCTVCGHEEVKQEAI